MATFHLCCKVHLWFNLPNLHPITIDCKNCTTKDNKMTLLPNDTWPHPKCLASR